MPNPQNREREIFDAALELTSAEARSGYLLGACGDDAQMRLRVESLLRACKEAGGFLPPEDVKPPSAGADQTVPISAGMFPMTEKPGDRIGRYKLREKIGEGGCGVVYVAEQEEPVRRRVAVKVIKLGMDTKAVIARFEAERQALALMDHPNIAKVLDAGATETGRPYFVMELVKGIAITRYCDENQMNMQGRLTLFIQICHAIQHAHQKGIIHRDIKPSNILVADHDGVAIPKVIDFGIAKATTDQRLTDRTLYTAIDQFIGTPAYMSPEQAKLSGLDIDTRSDIYSLGVLLYELLTGRTPFDAQELIKDGLDAIRRTIREVDPPRPSTRLSTLQGAALTATAKQHGTEGLHLLKLVRGDLDWIVMKCLEKDRTRRYDTANGLAIDLKRHLENEPVVARPPSTAYRFQKAWRRNRTAFAAATLITVALLAATGFSAWQAARATRAEKLAKDRLAESESVSKFLTEVLQSPGSVRNDNTVAMAEKLGAAADRLDIDLTNQPTRRAKLQDALAYTYDVLGLFEKAIPLREKVRNYHLAADGRENPETISAMLSLASSFDNAGRRDEALKLREEALPLSRKVNGPEHSDTLWAMNALASSYDGVGRHQDALNLNEEVLRISSKGRNPADPQGLGAMINLAESYDNVGRGYDALKMLERGLEISRNVNGAEGASTINVMISLGRAYGNAGRYEDALKLQEVTLPILRKVDGMDSPITLGEMATMARSCADLGRREEALQLEEEALPLMRKVFGPEALSTLWEMDQLASAYYVAGRYDDALKLREETLPLTRKVVGPEHGQTLWVMGRLADSYYEAGRYSEAKSLLQKACDLDPKNTGLLLELASWQAWSGEATDYEVTRLRGLQAAEGTDQARTAEAAAAAACLQPSTDAAFLAKALSLARRAVELGTNDPGLPYCQLALGLAEYRNSHYTVAEQPLAVVENAVAGRGRDDLMGRARLFRAMSLFREGRVDEARKLFLQAEAQMPPLPKDETRPFKGGRPRFGETRSEPTCDDVLMWWLAYKEAKSTLNESPSRQSMNSELTK